jgi:hypothetical protein
MPATHSQIAAAQDVSQNSGFIVVTQAATITHPSTWNVTGPFSISRCNDASASYLNGTIADVQTWQTALTPTQVVGA